MDADDAWWLNEFSWSLQARGYAHARVGDRLEFMHRLILGLVPGDGNIVDHINRNKIDNRRCNLRVTDFVGNARNRELVEPKDFRTGARGVSRKRDKWRAYVYVGRRQIYLGTFAERAYAHAAVGDFRRECARIAQEVA